eukprot:gene54221-44419_t
MAGRAQQPCKVNHPPSVPWRQRAPPAGRGDGYVVRPAPPERHAYAPVPPAQFARYSAPAPPVQFGGGQPVTLNVGGTAFVTTLQRARAPSWAQLSQGHMPVFVDSEAWLFTH